MSGQRIVFPVIDPHLITEHKFMNLFLTKFMNLLTPASLWEGVSHRKFHKDNNYGNVQLPVI